jgi:outer membrane biosynthesis protein TonB
MREPLSYAQKEEQRRKLISVAVTAGLYTLILAVGIILGILNPSEQAFSNTTVVLNLSGPVTPDLGLGSVTPSEKGEEKPEPEAPAPVKTASTDTAKIESPKVKSPDKPVEKSSPEPKVAAVAPQPQTSESIPMPTAPQDPGAPSSAPAPEPIPVEPWVPGERGPGSRTTGTNSSVLVPGKGEIPLTQGASVTIRKAEKGNSIETTLGGVKESVGQNLYVPIYYYLPLPKTVPASVYESIPDQIGKLSTVGNSSLLRKKAFLDFYENVDGLYRMKKDIQLDQRPPFWQILEDAGYDVADANYKLGLTLKPVIIGFIVTKENKPKGVEVLQSSGDPEVDRSVMYGFSQAAFWTKASETVAGRMVYKIGSDTMRR